MTSRQIRSPTLSLPQYGTPRRADRPTSGASAAVVAELLGTPLQWWQRYALDVAGELVHDERGRERHAYSIITVSVGRRAGKSLLVLVRLLATMLAARRRQTFYAAQNGKAGAERFRNDWIPLTQAAAAPLAQRLTARLTNGTETLTDRALGSYLRIFSPIPTALHGDAAELIVFDEAWSHTAERGDELEVAAFPLMATRIGAQLWILSAAGDIDSSWWLRWLDDGRAAAAADLGTGHCHLEWTAEGLDPERYGTEELWIETHPGIESAANPLGVVQLEFLRAEYRRNPAQFARSYLNVTDRTGTTSAPIELDAWQELRGELDRAGTLTLGIDVSPDQASGAIVACGSLGGGSSIVELLDHRAGHEWIAPRVAELCERYPIHRVALDAGGQSPSSVLYRPLQRRGVPLDALALADCTAASADLVAAVRAATVRNVAHPTLDRAVAAARRRLVGDGSWLWGRLSADADVSPLIAASYARWAHPEILGAAAPSIG